MTTRSASAEGDRSSDLMIHCRVGATTSSAMIATPHSQFRTMRTRSTRYAIGSAVDDETLADMNHLVYRISIRPLWVRVKREAGGGRRQTTMSPNSPPLASLLSPP